MMSETSDFYFNMREISGVDDDEGYASLTSFDSPCRGKCVMTMDDSNQMIQFPLSVGCPFDIESFDAISHELFENQKSDFYDILNCPENILEIFEEQNDDFAEDKSFSFDLVKHSISNNLKVSVFDDFYNTSDIITQLADDDDSRKSLLSCDSPVITETVLSNEPDQHYVTSTSEAEIGLLSYSKNLLPDMSQQFLNVNTTNSVTVDENFHYFGMVTDIGYIGSLSCPVTSNVKRVCGATRSKSHNRKNTSSQLNNGTTQFSGVRNKKITKRHVHANHCSSQLDHDYMKFCVYPKAVQNWLLTAGKNGKKEKQEYCSEQTKVTGSRGKTRSNFDDVSLSGKTLKNKKCHYVTLPGQHQNDYVYFAEKQLRTSRRKNSRISENADKSK